ncbi:SRPBCC family protein [Pontibacter sp. H259]|uniref:SRPBCC family protein n=1 Tax=Pontibacter sp. H259 TaxID=3133421 RepID=UPI0030C28CE3
MQSGLIYLGETVTWQATHFGIRQKLTSKITAFDSPIYFRDEHVKGAFNYFVHDHYFKSQGEFVVMEDTFEFSSPLGILGRIVDKLILEKYLTKLLQKRNQIIKDFAESGKWQALLEKSTG